jgi:hypothetical protein
MALLQNSWNLLQDILDNILHALQELGIPHWNRLRGIGNSQPVKLTVLIPAVGYLIMFNELIIRYGFSQGLFPTTNGDPDAISWRLLCLYFGLCLVAIGSLIYAARCPVAVKQCGSATEFAALTVDNTTLNAFLAWKGQVQQSEYVYLLEDGYGLHDHRTKVSIATAFWFMWNRSRVLSRVACSIFFFLGFIAIAIPSMSVFWRVCVLLFKHATIPFRQIS